MSIIDHRAISFILGENAYLFPKAKGVRAWFKAMLGEGILWVEGKSLVITLQCLSQTVPGKEAHERQRKLLAPALR